MLYYLSNFSDSFGPLRLFDYVTFRAGGAAVTAFLLTVILGGATARFLKKVFHRINDTNVKISVDAVLRKINVCSVSQHKHRAFYPLKGHHGITLRQVKAHRSERIYHHVLLRIKAEKHIKRKLKKLPQRTYGHGKAKRHQRHIKWGYPELEMLVFIKDIHKCKSNGGGKKSRYSMEH